MQAFLDSIYTRPEGPYTAWLKTTREKDDFEVWLTQHLNSFRASRITNRPIRVLDIGCSWGSTSFRIMRVLRKAGLTLEYIGVDPYRPQLDEFRRLANMSDLDGIQLHLAEGDAETWLPDGSEPMYDLVIGSHMLYYTKDLRLTLGKMITMGVEVLIVHHGPLGINVVHEMFRNEVHPGPNVISTDEDVWRELIHLPRGGRQFQRNRFQSSVDISSIVDPESPTGRNLISFFLERDFYTIDPEVVAKIREFFRTYGPSYRMPHDVGIITVTA